MIFIDPAVIRAMFVTILSVVGLWVILARLLRIAVFTLTLSGWASGGRIS
jgi:hypothetical protein